MTNASYLLSVSVPMAEVLVDMIFGCGVLWYMGNINMEKSILSVSYVSSKIVILS